MTIVRRLLLILLAGLLCSTAAEVAYAQVARFEVRVENVSRAATLKLPAGGSVAVPVSAGVWVLHTGPNPIFTPGETEPGLGLKGMAEAGMAAAFAPNLRALRAVRDAGAFEKPIQPLVRRMSSSRMRNSDPPPVSGVNALRMLQPGQRFEFTITALPGDHLSLAMMIAQSNDGFIANGQDGIPLFGPDGRPVKGDITSQLFLWDAGTEVNEPPGVGRNQGLRQGAPNAGDPERRPVVLLADAEYGSFWPAVTQIIRVSITPAGR